MRPKVALGSIDDLFRPENGSVLPNGTVFPQVTGPDALTTYAGQTERIVASHQLLSGQFHPQRFYVLKAQQNTHIFHPDPPYDNGSIIWGYDGIYPGPTFISKYGEPILVRIFNDLYDDPAANLFVPGGFGDAQISTHLHNGHTGSESDGNPEDIYPVTPLAEGSPDPQYPASILALRFRDHHYAMFAAGIDSKRPENLPAPNVNGGDPRERVSTLWYHDHSMHHTAENVYKGLVGFHLLFDEVDSGDENDQNPAALRLPSHEFDVPLLIQDKRFDAQGQLFLDRSAITGFLGDKFVVNGAIQPRLPVLRRKYRFRLLNAGPSRFYKFFLVKNGVDQPFQIIGNDESLLEHPLTETDGSGVSSVLVSVAERSEIVIDFSQHNQGDQLFLVNRLIMKDDGQGPEYDFDDAFAKYTFRTLGPGEGDQIMRFDVGEAAPDSPPVPPTLRLNPDLPAYLFPLTKEHLKSLPNHHEFGLNKTGGFWTIAPPGGVGQVYREFRVDWRVTQGKTPDEGGGEVWTIINMDETWSHPIHIHLEEFRILLRNGEEPHPYEKVKKDVLLVGPLEEIQIFVRFRDFQGKYPIHCHNVTHEDHAMMIRFDVAP